MREIAEQEVGRVSGQLDEGMPAGRDGHRTGANGPGTADVEGRVADHPGTLGPRVVVPQPHFAPGGAGHVVPVFMLVAETAEIEILPQAEVLQFDARASARVAG